MGWGQGQDNQRDHRHSADKIITVAGKKREEEGGEKTARAIVRTRREKKQSHRPDQRKSWFLAQWWVLPLTHPPQPWVLEGERERKREREREMGEGVGDRKRGSIVNSKLILNKKLSRCICNICLNETTVTRRLVYLHLKPDWAAQSFFKQMWSSCNPKPRFMRHCQFSLVEPSFSSSTHGIHQSIFIYFFLTQFKVFFKSNYSQLWTITFSFRWVNGPVTDPRSSPRELPVLRNTDWPRQNPLTNHFKDTARRYGASFVLHVSWAIGQAQVFPALVINPSARDLIQKGSVKEIFHTRLPCSYTANWLKLWVLLWWWWMPNRS